jgi:hypothetical protein
MIRSPALLALAGDAVSAGVKVTDALDLIGALHNELGALATTITQTIIERIWEPLAQQGRLDEIEPLLRRGRLLLLQGAVSTLADRLGEALLQQADEITHGDVLRDTIESIRVGAFIDTHGNIQHRRTR